MVNSCCHMITSMLSCGMTLLVRASAPTPLIGHSRLVAPAPTAEYRSPMPFDADISSSRPDAKRPDLSPLKCALTKSLNFKPRGMNTYAKRPGGGEPSGAFVRDESSAAQLSSRLPQPQEFDCDSGIWGGLIRLRESRPRIAHRERAVRLGRNFDPVCRPVVRWCGRNAGAGCRRRHRSDGQGRGLVVICIGDENARSAVLFPAQERKVQLPEVFQARRRIDHFH